MLRKLTPVLLVRLLVVLSLTLLMGSSVSAVAPVPTPTLIPAPAIRDGRVNGNDIAAPVAVFCKFTYPDANNTALKPVNRWRSVLDRVELWGITDSTRQFHEIVMVPGSDIMLTPSTLGVHVDAEGFGYVLYHNADGSLTVTAPPDREGKVYTFTWTPGRAINC